MSEVLGFTPWRCTDGDDQIDICHAVRDFPRVTVRSGNGVGKTAIAAQTAIWFLTCFVPSIVVTTAPTTRQVEKLLWGEIRAAYRRALIPIGGELLNTEIRIDDKWYALGFATDEKEKFQGFHAPFVFVIVDEASGVTENIFEAIEGLMTTAGARILLIGNPTDPTGYFGRTFLHPKHSKGWKHLHLDCWNSPNVRAGKTLVPALCAHSWPHERLTTWGEYNPFYQVRVKGNFPVVGEDNLIPYHMVHSALERSIPPAGNKLLSVDVARFGNDASVISRLWGAQFRVLKKLYTQDGVMIANRVVEQLKEDVHKDVESVKIDIIGYGAGVFDELNRMKKHGNDVEKEILKRVKLIAVNVSEKCRSRQAQKNYANIRAEAAFTVRELFESGQIDIDDEELAVQAANIKYTFVEGRQRLEKKKEFKARLQGSPDEFDSLLIAKAITRGAKPSIH